MSKTTAVVGGLIIIVLAALVFVLVIKEPATQITNATSTPTGSTGGVTPIPGGNEAPVAGAPVATTNSTFTPTDTTAVVEGIVNPNGASTSYWYEFGTTQALGMQSPRQLIGSGDVATLAPGYITGLTKSTTYYYRLVAENSFGKTAGAQRTLKTSTVGAAPVGVIPSVQTLAANGITKSSATLRGTVTPGGVMTQYWFEYGKNSNLGNTTAFVSVGDGSAAISASATPTLEANTTYHYRINAQNQYGTVNGAVRTFKTSR